jgi:hypothetical protein
MTSFGKVLGPAVLAAATLGFSAVSASAYIACSGDDCWHVHERYHYPASAGIVIHEDTWHWGPRAHFRWREHAGRGYWHGGEWHSW